MTSESTSLREERARRFSYAILIAIAISVVVSAFLAGASDAPADVAGGDLPAFYGAGRIAMDGEWDALYDLDRQRDAQRDLLGSADEGGVWPFVYPPQVALAYAPLSVLPYALAYVVHTAFMAFALWAAIRLSVPMLPWLEGRVAIAFAASMLFWPMFRAVTGGSNTALILLIIVASWRQIHDGNEVLGGLVLSALLFKPQFAIPLIGLFLVARYWGVIVGAVAGSVAFYISGALLLGWNWVSTWVEVATDFGTIDAEVNGHSAISIVGFTENIVGVGISIPVVVAWVAVVALILGLVWLWWSAGRNGLDILLAVTIPAVLLLPPHVMSHDGALVLLTVGVAIATWAATSWVPWVAAIWLLGASQLFIKPLGFSPGFFMLLLILVWVSEPVRDRDRWLSGSSAETLPTRQRPSGTDVGRGMG